MLTFILLTYIVLVLVFLGAGTFPWVLHFTAATACIGCIICCKRIPKHAGPLIPFVIAFVSLLTLTVVPLPSSFESIVGRERTRQNQLAGDALAEAADLQLIKDHSHSFSLSRNRAGTMRMILLVISGFAMAALSSSLSEVWKERYLRTLTAIVISVAIAGYVSQWLRPQGKSIWWLFTVAHGRPVGCFINRNHFGGFVAMLCPATVILFMNSLSLRRFWTASAWGTGFAAMSLAVIMSLSRGAWMAYAASGLAVAILALSHKRVLMSIGIIALISIVCLGVTMLPHDELDTRLESLNDISKIHTGQMRLSTWRDGIRVIPDYPVLGTGANGFHMVFPQYRTATTRKAFRHAENEYVELAIEYGFAGIILMVVICTGIAQRWRDNHVRRSISRTIALAVGGALIVVLVHAVFDFALRIPLYFVVFASLLGLVITPHYVRSSIRHAGLNRSNAPFHMRRIAVPLMGLILVLVISAAGKKTYNLDSSDFLEKADIEGLCQALVWSPTSWQVWYHIGRHAIITGSPDSYSFGERCIIRATEYDPNNYRLWRELCRFRISRNDMKGAREAYDRLKRLRSWVRIKEMEQLETEFRRSL